MANESRLIDANKIKYRTVGAGGWSQPENVVSDYEIEKMPTVDAVEVVRCKDCKYKDEKIHACMNIKFRGERIYIWVEPDDFCSYGERKDNG